MHPLIAALRGQLVVSCQAYPGEPLRHPETMAQMAEAAVTGGAVAIRAQGLADISAITGRVDVPVIGLWKSGHDGVFITPTLRHARAVLDAGAQIVALDGTRRPRPDGRTLAETVAALRASHPDSLVMADCGSLGDAQAAADAGVDILGTTLAGYTDERPKTDGPDLDLVTEIAHALPRLPLIAEGRIHTPAQARTALAAGAHAVVVGTAITHPTTITGWFAQALRH
ncbi:N-acylglucosamine-6-phosphate 2-epimerase [Austwickia chelonae]|uniref:Putative N-acetylmannosamine-6-phosphate 2-epimerase n=1 Tax=Austwickia chelonae NBRC 105200 TaxID=1184607 RepID=K6V929_9MICO|nr:N-acetylmannosamine-6-phosphate 2-epimerase [Austwickia chelonae]GAB78738.1 putative N-acetylmannosamine-6-phosphate 2-epimerase [Austwickia chelonae NBRC 105200]SEW35167.1 N-acylglucosamine-6-phosphate 2-epimerase [Austwickia chelonae]